MKNIKNEKITKDEKLENTKFKYFRELQDINYKFDFIRMTINNLINLFDKVDKDYSFNFKTNTKLNSIISDINSLLDDLIKNFNFKF